MPPCCNEFACCAWCVGSGEASISNDAAWGTKDRWILYIRSLMYRYWARSSAVRGVLVRVRLPPCTIALFLGGGLCWLAVCCHVYFCCSDEMLHTAVHLVMTSWAWPCILRLVHYCSSQWCTADTILYICCLITIAFWASGSYEYKTHQKTPKFGGMKI